MADEEAISGASGILGVNALQKAINAFDNTVTRMQGIVGKMGDAERTFGSARAATGSGSWNRISNWRINPDDPMYRTAGMPQPGGTGTNGGSGNTPPSSSGTAPRPANGGGSSGGGSGTGGGGGGSTTPPPPNGGVRTPVPGGAHRGATDSLPGEVTPGSHYGGLNEPRISPVTKVVAAAGATSGAYQHFTQGTGDVQQDSYRYNMVASQFSVRPGSVGRNEQQLFGHMDWGMNGADKAAAGVEIMSHAGGVVGSEAERSMSQAAQQISYSNPSLGAAKSAGIAQGLYGPKGYVGLRTVGITTIGNNGKRQSPTQIAAQVLKQVDPQETIRSANDIEAFLNDPMSNLNVTLGNWTANGIISGDQQGAVRDSIGQILKARAAGISATKLNSLLNTRNTSAKSRATLQRANIGNSDSQRAQDKDTEKAQGAIDRLPAFDKGVKDATDAVGDFTKVINKITSIPGINTLIGRTQGSSSDHMGKLGIVGGWARSIGSGISSVLANPLPGFTGGNNETRMSVGGGLTGVTVAGPSSSSSPMAEGGNNETRMSVQGGLTGVSVASQPHNAGRAAMGGAAAGGPAQATGGGRAPTAAKKGSSGQKMILPARGKLGQPFGASGSHWSSGHHTGQDIECPTGTPVHAPANGTVTFAGWDGPYGQLVKINHGGGVVSYMAHNSRLVAHVGAKVRQGQLIAYSGATGNVTGPHCHFEVRVNGRAVNPMQFVTGGSRVSGAGGGAGGGTAGSGTNAANGSGTSFDGGGSGAGGAGSTIGMSELEVLAGAGSGGGGGYSDITAADTSGGGGSSIGGSGTISAGGGKGAAAVFRALSSAGFSKVVAAGIMGNMQAESGFDPNIVQGGGHSARPNTSVGYGLVQWTPGTKLKGYIGNRPATIANEVAALRDQLQGKGPSPEAAAGRALKGARTPEQAAQIFGLKYERYAGGVQGGRAAAARRFFHAYSKGAWDIPKDEVAHIHKGEMVVPSKEADQIRQVLLNGNPYKAMGNQGKNAGAGAITFAANSINITVQSTGNPTTDGQAIGKAFMDTLQQNIRIESLQKGAV